MQLTREYLEGRLSGLRDQHAQLQADLYAVEGAHQAIEQLLMYLNTPEPAPAEATDA